MNASVKQDSKPDGAAVGAAHAEAAVKAAGDAVDAVVGAVSGKPADDKAKPAKAKDSGTGIGGFFGDLWDSIKEFFSNFKENGSIGSIIGAALGLGGAWLAGNFFGGGILSTILMVALAVPLMLAGSDTVGGWINDKIGSSKKESADKSAAPARTREVAASTQPATPPAVQQGNARATDAGVSAPSGLTTALTNEELNAIIAAPDNLKDRVQLVLPSSPNGKVQVISVADSVSSGKYIVDAQALRDSVAQYEARRAAEEGRSAQPISGISITPMSDGKIRIVGTTVGSLPTQSGQIGR